MIITTNRLVIVCDGSLACACPEITAMVRWLNDPEIVGLSEQRHRIHTIDTQISYIASFDDSPNIFGAIRREGKVIGTITAYLDVANLTANLGILIGDKPAWGNGYGTEAWAGMTQYLFARKYRKIEAGCMWDNTGMMRLAKKAGMHVEGMQPEHFLLREQEAGHAETVHYSELVHWGHFNESARSLAAPGIISASLS